VEWMKNRQDRKNFEERVDGQLEAVKRDIEDLKEKEESEKYPWKRVIFTYLWFTVYCIINYRNYGVKMYTFLT
jgi:hypothetical protein